MKTEWTQHPFSKGRRENQNSVDTYVKAANDSDESRRHLLNEIEIARNLIGTPGILHPIDVHEGPSLVFPYLERSLRSFLGAVPPFELKENYLIPLLRTLDAIHERGIVHGDLKLDNIRVDANGSPKIADFGRSIRLDKFQPNYIASLSQHSPPDSTVSPAYDVYSIGVITYQLLFGDHFMRDFQLKGRRFDEIPESDSVPPELLKFIMLATEPSAGNRFSSAAAALAYINGTSEGATVIESYDLAKYFEKYIEFMKATFVSSRHDLNRFDEFAGENGIHYYQRLERWLKSPIALLLHVRIGSEVKGILEASITSDGTGLISTLFIHESARKMGLARRLEARALDFFRTNGCSHATLNVAESNTAALAYYRKTGWIEVAERAYPDALRLMRSC